MTWTKVGRLALLSGLLMLAGCQTILGRSNATRVGLLGRAPFCSVAEPISYSSRDTVETIKLVREHNAVGIELCGWMP